MAGDPGYIQRYIGWLIEQEIKRNHIAGVSIALVDERQVLWTAGFGYEDVAAGRAAGAQTPYRLGSIAKVLTATAAMQLAEEGRMDIDRPLADYLPGFALRSRFTASEPITPRNVMDHHSGLPANFLRGMLGEARPFSDIVTAVRDEYVAYPPGFVFSYSNLGVTLLGAAIEQRTGEPFDRRLRRSVFEPLAMHDTRFESNPAFKVYDPEGKPIQPIPLRDLPSGGLVSTADDMARFMRMVLAGGELDGHRVLRDETLAEMLRPQNEHIALDLGLRVGLGWMLSGIDIRNAGPVASHGGALFDSHSLMVLLPEQKLGVAVMSNSAAAQDAVKRIATETLKLALETYRGIRQPENGNAATETGPAQMPLSSYAAWYDSMIGLVKVNPARDALDAEVMGHTLQLRPQGDGRFGLRYKLLGLIPVHIGAFDGLRVSVRNIDGRRVLVGHIGEDTILLGERLTPTPIPQALLDYVGEYEFVDAPDGFLPEHMAMRLEDGMLIGECSLPQMPGFLLRIGLQPISANEVLISGLGTGKGETIRVLEGEEKRLLFSGLDLRKKTN